MVEMDLETVAAELGRRFAAELPEFYQRRVIFWIDPDREFADRLQELSIPGVTVLVRTGRNEFALKKRICADEQKTNFLVYCPFTPARPEDDWLLNVELCSESFRADRVSLWMEEMGLPEGAALRTAFTQYRKFFNAKDRRARAARLVKKARTPEGMRLAVLASLAGAAEASPNAVTEAVLRGGLKEEQNRAWQNFLSYGAKEDFCAMAAAMYGWDTESDGTLTGLAKYLFISAASQTMDVSLAGLSVGRVDRRAYCYDFITEWIRRDEQGAFPVAREVEIRLGLQGRLAQYAPAMLLRTGCFPCIHVWVLKKLFEKAAEDIRPEEVRETLEARRGLPWYDQWKDWYDALVQLAEMETFRRNHEGDFHYVKAAELWRAYTTELYHMDTYYRRFQQDFQKMCISQESLLDDAMKGAADAAERLYAGWFLGELGRNWVSAAAEDFAEIGHAAGVPQQETFYAEKVQEAPGRVFVIISDALRYEVGAELKDQLLRTLRCRVKLEAREAIFPTATQFGMAALLPHYKLTAVRKSGGFAVLADGRPTDSSKRGSVLAAKKASSVALQAEDILRARREERKAMVKGKDVVYIYHNRIDNMGHASDKTVFRACGEAMDEIASLVRSIGNDFGGAHVLITADHGFLYTYSELREDSKADGGEGEEIDRRYVIAKTGTKPVDLLPVAWPMGGDDYTAFAPYPNVRIRKKGGGLNFVHGGLSLQELAVPVLDCHLLRTESREYQQSRDIIDTRPVELALLTSVRKITSSMVRLQFFQKEPVGGSREAAVYTAVFLDDTGRAVSDSQTLFADHTEQEGNRRVIQAEFCLKPVEFQSHRVYRLHLEEKSGRLAPVNESFQISLAFRPEDYE